MLERLARLGRWLGKWFILLVMLVASYPIFSVGGLLDQMLGSYWLLFPLGVIGGLGLVLLRLWMVGER